MNGRDTNSPREIRACEECGGTFYPESSKMAGLCPACAHMLYGYPECDHQFRDGICVKCHAEEGKKRKA